tara:strand:+ start:893 stop:1030 length:138 start_codon:yes stop_codon:yes gene_type:complete
MTAKNMPPNNAKKNSDTITKPIVIGNASKKKIPRRPKTTREHERV